MLGWTEIGQWLYEPTLVLWRIWYDKCGANVGCEKQSRCVETTGYVHSYVWLCVIMLLCAVVCDYVGTCSKIIFNLLPAFLATWGYLENEDMTRPDAAPPSYINLRWAHTATAKPHFAVARKQVYSYWVSCSDLECFVARFVLWTVLAAQWSYVCSTSLVSTDHH